MQEDPIESVSKGLFDSFFEHALMLIPRLLMSLKSLFLKKQWLKEGTYPALIAIELTKTPVATERNTLLVRFQIHLTRRVRYHLEKFVACKQGNPSEVQNYIFGGVNNEFPQLHVDKLGVPIKIVNLPYDRSPQVINKIINRSYLYSEATFEIPCNRQEKINIRVIAKTRDMKDKSYELCSEWIEL